MPIPNFHHGARFIRFFAEIFREFEESCCGAGSRGTYEFMIRVPTLRPTVVAAVLDGFTVLTVYRFCVGPIFQHQITKITVHG